MAKGKRGGIPIVYESKKAETTIVDSKDDRNQVECQLNGYNSKVGFATNISSSLYTMLEEFPMGSEEEEAILKRLKIGRVIQGEIIDGVKGLKVPPFREHWTKYKKITEDMTPEEVKKWEFNNKILCKIRPAFFRFLYPHYMARYNKEIKKYNIYSHLAFEKPFGDILQGKNKTKEDEELIQEYKNHSFFLDNNSVVNRISRYMRTNISLIGKFSTQSSRNFDYSILQNENNTLTKENILLMEKYLQEYKAFKKGLRNNIQNSYANLDAFINYLRKQCFLNISQNESKLADYAIEITYGKEISMVEFAWKMFPDGLLMNIMEKSSGIIYMPVKDDRGNIDYLWSKYSIKEFHLEDLYTERENKYEK